MRTVYIDVLFVLNTAVNYLLLLATAKIVDTEHMRMRLLGSAALGGIYAALVYFPQIAFMYELTVRVLFAALMVFVAFGKRFYFRLFLVFFSVSFAFGGGVLAIQAAFSGVDMRNGVIYVDMTLRNVLFASAALYLLLEILFRRAASGRVKAAYTDVEMTSGERRVNVRALIDTGCTLADPVSGKRVVLVGFSDFLEVLPAEEREIVRATRGVSASVQLEALARCKEIGRFRLLPYSTIENGGLLLAYRPDSLKVENMPRAANLVACSLGELNDPRRYRAVVGV